MKPILLGLVLLLLSLPAVWPIIEPGFFPTHDDTHVVRVDQMYQALRSRQFPVRWVPDLGYGYGYPIFNFYNPLPYYFGALFMFLGFTALTATKVMFAFPIILSGFTMYRLTRRYLSQLAAFTAAAFYIYAPYHAVQIYVRGSIAEYWAYAFIPLVIYAFLTYRRLLAPISLAFLILSHNLTAMMFIAILGFLVLFHGHKVRSIASILLSLGLSAFFWLPALVEKDLTRVNDMVAYQFNTLEHFVFPNQLWSSVWGYGGSAPGKADGLSFMIGKLHIIFTLFSLWLIKFSQKVKESTQRFLLLAMACLLLSTFMLLPLSSAIWHYLKPLSFIQFPWRWLTFVAFSTSILTGFVINQLFSAKTLIISGYALIALFVFYSTKFFQPQFKFPATSQDFLSDVQVKWAISRESDEYLPIGFIVPLTQEEALGGKLAANQALVAPLLKSTPVRRLANAISLLTVLGFMLQFSHAGKPKFRRLNPH